jgi:bacterial/archaeal transporter family-2 protein
MIMIVWLCLLAALAGVLTPAQSGANGEMGRVLGNPFGVVLLSLSISLVFTLVAGLFTRNGDTSGFSHLTQAPWWAWVGGFCGPVVLLSQPLAAPRLGAAVYIGITVTASAIASIMLDHFGLLGFHQHSASIGRLIGAALMIAGVSLIAKY